MSESIPVILLLTLAGGFQDAYSYNIRSHVFANAQTGNIVLFAQNIVLGHYIEAQHYIWPIMAFIFGVYFSEKIRFQNHFHNILHWRQIVLAIEIILLIIVGFLPARLNDLANVLMSFACAMQVNSFKKMDGQGLATTMCIGNMRSGTEILCHYLITKDPKLIPKFLKYYMVILVFACGAALGAVSSLYYHFHAIWLAVLMLLGGFLLMFFSNMKEKEN